MPRLFNLVCCELCVVVYLLLLLLLLLFYFISRCGCCCFFTCVSTLFRVLPLLRLVRFVSFGSPWTRGSVCRFFERHRHRSSVNIFVSHFILHVCSIHTHAHIATYSISFFFIIITYIFAIFHVIFIFIFSCCCWLKVFYGGSWCWRPCVGMRIIILIL